MTNQICLTFSALAVLLIVGCSSGVEPRPLSFTFEELRSTAFIDSLLALEEYRTPEGSELVFGLKYGMTWSEVYDRSKELETNTGGKVYHWDVDNIAAEVANIEVRGLIDGFTYRANFVDDLGKSYQASYLLSPRYEDRRLVEVSIFFKGDLGLKLQKSIEKRLRADNPKWLMTSLLVSSPKPRGCCSKFSILPTEEGLTQQCVLAQSPFEDRRGMDV